MKESDRLKMEADPLLIFLPHYLSSDLVSSGMALDELNAIRTTGKSLEERWQSFLPFWEKVENTGYAQAIKIAARDLYGVSDLNSGTWKPLQQAMEKRRVPGLHQWVLKTRGGIGLSVNDVSTTDVDKDLVPVMRFDDYATPQSRNDLSALSRRTMTAIHSLDNFLEALEAEFTSLARRIVGVKIGLAYARSLGFDKVTYAEAETVFNRIYQTRTYATVELLPYPGRPIATRVPQGIGFDDAKPLQDYIVHKIVQLAARHKLPVQIHTGLQEGNENIIGNSDPTLLTDLFREYSEVKFDVFHAGYPYYRELASLAKNFPNVYPDLCWVHIISPAAARTILSEWLDTVPSNKILAFGGDYRFVEGVYGHVVMARKNIAATLREKRDHGDIEPKQVPYLASRILRENARELFSL
jgi:predicted TIM-barrel fold metal-dependent hydrolase